MLTKNKGRIALICVIAVSMIAAYGYFPLTGFVPLAKADWLYSAKDIISDSDRNASSSHQVVIQMSAALDENQYIEVEFQSGFTGFADVAVICPENSTASTTSSSNDYRVVQCIVDGGQTLAVQPTEHTVMIYNIQNPGTTGDKDITITTYNADDEVIDRSVIKVFIIDDVTVTATVDATLTFAIDGLGPDAGKTSVNGIAISASSTATEMNFSTLNTSASTTLGQSLSVSTNATDGFVVTVQKDQELQNAAGATINSFDNSPDGTGSTTATIWREPRGILASSNTYGHWGLTSDDIDEDNPGHMNDFFQDDAAYYAGTNGTEPLIVMAHDGPADGTTQNIGTAAVAYTIKITELQEAGDYSMNLTYICTPTY